MTAMSQPLKEGGELTDPCGRDKANWKYRANLVIIRA